MKLNPHYFRPGVSHVCMFCDTPLASLKDGKLYPLGSKTHVVLQKTLPGVYTINCCGACAQTVNFKDQTVLDEIHENVLKSKEFIDQVQGTQTQVNPDDKPVAGFYVVESDPSKRTDTLRAHAKVQR